MNLSLIHRIVVGFVFATPAVILPESMLAQRVIPGDTVRIATVERTYKGELLRRDSAGLVMSASVGDTLRLEYAWIRRAEVLRGHPRAGWSSVGKGAAIGVLTGALLGAAAALDKGANQESRELRGLFVIAAVVAGTGSGIVIGGLAAFRHVEQWERFELYEPIMVHPQ